MIALVVLLEAIREDFMVKNWGYYKNLRVWEVSLFTVIALIHVGALTYLVQKRVQNLFCALDRSVGEGGKDDGGDEKKDITFTVER